MLRCNVNIWGCAAFEALWGVLWQECGKTWAGLPRFHWPVEQVSSKLFPTGF